MLKRFYREEWKLLFYSLVVYISGFSAIFEVRAEFSETEFKPLQFRLNGQSVLLEIEKGTRRVRIQVDEGKEKGWRTRSITHLDGRSGHLKLLLPDSVPINALRIEVSRTDPFPNSLYSGKKVFSETADQQISLGNQGIINDMLVAEDEERAPIDGGEVTVEESDIWKWRDRTLYFFNQQRGLQVFSLDKLDSPKRTAQLRMPAAGEQLYLIGEEHVALLANRSNSYQLGGSGSGSEIILVRHLNDELRIEQRYPLEGSFVESRMVGSRLYTVTRVWENIEHADGVWRTRSGMKIYAFEFADPLNPVALESLDLTSDESYYYNAVVTATPEYLFVIPSVYDSKTRTNSSWVHVIDINEPSKKMEISHRIPLGGYLNDKFKLAVRDGVLTTISQVWRNEELGRHTLVETHDLRQELDFPTRRLDSLVLAPGETVRATRFDGDRLYVVTFRQIDPLFAIDISRPRRLKVLGHIDIPGWSTYMELFGETGRILSIGIEESRVAVSIFDVADSEAMALTHRVYLGDEETYSWSEGNYDEKAVGFFPDEGLLVLPFSGRVDGSYRKQMQIMDVGDNKLIKRGVINSDFNARRGKLLDKNKLVVISGQQLRVIDIAKRDNPEVMAEMTIAWSVDRVLSIKSHLVQLEEGYSNWWNPEQGSSPKLRITSKSDPDTVISELEIATNGQLIGARAQGDFLHLATSRTQAIRIEHKDGTSNWNYETFFASQCVDISDPLAPEVTGSAELKISDKSVYLGDLKSKVLPGGELLWFPEASNNNYSPCWLCIDMVMDVDIGRPFLGPSGDGNGWIFVTAVDELVKPKILSSTRLVNQDDKLDNRIEIGPIFVSGNILRFGYHLSNWNEGKHNGRHLLRQINYSDPVQPVQSNDFSVPGLVKHIYTTSEGGTVLLTTRQKTKLNEKGLSTWSQDLILEASIFDEVNAFLVDSVEIKNGFHSPIIGDDRYVLISSNGSNRWWSPEGIEDENLIKVFAWSETNDSIESLPNIEMEGYFNTMSIVGNKLFAYDYGVIEVLAINDLPEKPRSQLFSFTYNYSSKSSIIEVSNNSQKAWIATGNYGVETLDISSLSGDLEVGQPEIIAKGINKEWLEIDISHMQMVKASSQDFIGSIPDGYGWRFQPSSDREGFEKWNKRHFESMVENGLPVPSADMDSDGDGISNLIEFYTGTSPNDSVSAARPSVNIIEDEIGNKYFVWKIIPSPSADGVNMYFEISHDLINWQKAEKFVKRQKYGPVISARLVETIDSRRSTYLRLRLELE
ncbi:beta-propeller domain-containing protein [Verrucomicrobiales bacterium]|nr:beta-propeller domain-containing protein [Verrucomicrobiales bacterium]